MTKPLEIKDKLLELAKPVCEGAGYELVDLTFARERDGWVLRLYIDDHDGIGGIGFDDCERVSRELGAMLDVEDPIEQAYRLEVSSPGVDRPLRTAAHFRRFVGETIKARVGRGVDGRRNFKGAIVGVTPAERPEGASDSEDDRAAEVTVDVDGSEWSLPVRDIDSARLVPDWDRVLKEATSGPGASNGESSQRSV